MTEKELLELISNNQQLMQVLGIISELPLKDAWLAAGSVRNVIWDEVTHQHHSLSESDIDIVFYDPEMTYENQLSIETKLNQEFPDYQWQVKNQYLMHHHSPNTKPYTSSCDAISKYPETATAIAIKVDNEDKLTLFAPYGLSVIVSLEIHPTPHFKEDSDRMRLYKNRLKQKNWKDKWPQLKCYDV